MRKTIVLLCLIALTISALDVTGFDVTQPQVQKIGMGEDPHINDFNQVVWEGYDGVSASEIFFWDGTTIQITNNEHQDANPQINDNGQVVWQGYDGNDYEIYLWDGNVVQLTNNEYNDVKPQINNKDHVVWVANEGTSNADIMIWDGTKSISLYQSGEDDTPRINDNDVVVWRGKNGSIWVIYLWDGDQIIQISNNDYHNFDPEINNNGQVVWEERNRFTDEIMFWNGNDTITIPGTNHSGNAQINELGHILWRNIEEKLMFWDGTSATEISEGLYRHYSLNDNDDVAWIRNNGTFVRDAGHTIKLINNCQRNYCPEINNLGSVVWVGSIDDQGYIYYVELELSGNNAPDDTKSGSNESETTDSGDFGSSDQSIFDVKYTLVSLFIIVSIVVLTIFIKVRAINRK